MKTTADAARKTVLLLGAVGSNPDTEVLRKHLQAWSEIQELLPDRDIVSILALCYPKFKFLKEDNRPLWLRYSFSLLRSADEVCFLLEPELFQSEGCAKELNYCLAVGKTFFFYNPVTKTFWREEQ